MLPFDRFVRAVDEWGRDNPGEDVFLQIGAGTYEPRHVPFARTIPLAEYRNRLETCDLFVAHVGMGSILQAMEAGKQMLLMVRDHTAGEHTTDHQSATAARFRDRPGIAIVESGDALKAGMSRLLHAPSTGTAQLSPSASPELLAAVANYISGVEPAR